MSFASSVKKHFELIISFVAVTMAIAAVVVAFYEASLMREQARLSVKPSVWIETNSRTSNQDDENGGEFEIVITNRGLGPATVEYMTVLHNGVFLRSWQEALSLITLDDSDQKSIIGISYEALPQKYVLPEGAVLEAFSIRAPSELVRRINAAFDQYEYTICVCSFYNECWISEGINSVPQVTGECSIDPKYSFHGDKKLGYQ